MATISLAMIVRDCEKTLDKCLSSFAPIVDELIIVDTGSIDNTVEIARKYTERTYYFKWIDDFSAARNYAFSKCTKDFIYWADGDDFILPEDAEKIKKLDFDNFDIIICQYVYARDEFGQPICVVPRERFIRRSLGLLWEQPIHEYLPISKGRMHISDIKTYHEKQHGTSERNLSILEKIVKANPTDSRNIYYFGTELLDFGRTDEGIQYLEEFVRRADGFWEDIYRAHYRLAQVFIHRDEAKFKEHLYRSIQIEERRAEPFFLMGQYWESKQQWERALQWYEFCTAVKRPRDLLASYQPEYYTWLPSLQASICCNAVNDLLKAYEWNERALKYRPKDSRMINNQQIYLRALKERKAKERKDGQKKRLNLGCGCKPEAGYVNVDIFEGPTVDEVFEFDQIPYLDGTISAILSEHSLEHVGWARAEAALQEWSRVLCDGGQLLLKIPDFEDCCKKYLETPKDNSHIRQWFKNTVYGAQKSLAGEPDEAQYHRAGWSADEMCEKLKKLGFTILTCRKYDGWSTPSMEIIAVKGRAEAVADFRIEGENKKLNLGCRNKIKAGFVNMEIYKTSDDVAYLNFMELPYKDGTIGAIYTEALERVGFEDTRRALKEWFRVLVPGGELTISFIDFEDVCRTYMDYSSRGQLLPKAILKTEMFGDTELPDGLHSEMLLNKSMFSESELRSILQEFDFILE